MPPALATAFTIAAILLLLHRDSKLEAEQSAALWLPLLWLGITGSRFVSQWMSLGQAQASNISDGSPVDAAFFGVLIAAGIWVLAQRRVDLGQIVRNNRWLVVLMVYGMMSIAWSDSPLVASKRWIKTLGHPVMALIILTDPDPSNALRSVLRRCGYFLLSISVLFIKYFPEYGRSFDAWTGQPANQGVGLTKNDLGYLCMVLGIFFIWNLLTVWRAELMKARRSELFVSALFIWVTVWLLGQASSATSMMTLALGALSMLALGSPLVSKRFLGTYAVVAALLVIGLEAAFDVYEQGLAMVGRDATLTDRTAVWADVLAMQDRPLFGFGFESFWLDSQLEILWRKWWWHPTQAHNGYIETYLNLGATGVALLAAVLLSTFRKICAQMTTDFAFARLRFAFLAAIVAFNYTEAAFKGTHFVWTIFYIIAIDLGSRWPHGVSKASDGR